VSIVAVSLAFSLNLLSGLDSNNDGPLQYLDANGPIRKHSNIEPQFLFPSTTSPKIHFLRPR
jgi:hypothetical protein